MSIKKDLKSSAIEYYKGGLNLLPTNEDKSPAVNAWTPIQKERQTQDLFDDFFKRSLYGIGVVTGIYDREVVDIDTKHDLSGKLVEHYKGLVDQYAPGLWDSLTLVKTVSDGFHLVYRCDVTEGNLKLAKRLRTAEELKENSNLKPPVLIETRGKGGYTIAPPSPGYELISGDYINPVKITPEQRNILFNCARFLDETEDETPTVRKQKRESNWEGKTAWDDYNEKNNCVDRLVRHGWTEVAQNGNKISVQRPVLPGEKAAKQSGHVRTDLNVFFCWSESAGFETRLPYSPVDIYYLLEHNGDKAAGAKALYKEGYGDRQTARLKPIRTEEGEEGEGKIAYQLYERNGSYVAIKGEYPSQLTNFTITSLYQIRSKEASRIIHFKSVEGESDTLQVSNDQLTSEAFAKLAKSIGNFMTTWSRNQFEFILHHASKNQKVATAVEYLGHQEDGKIWAFGNGVFSYSDQQFYPTNDHGIVETKEETYFIPQHKNKSEPMRYKAGEITFREYYELMKKAYGQNGEVGAAVTLGYAFSDILFNQSNNIFQLFLFGGMQTGKTSFAECVVNSFYAKNPAKINLKSKSTQKSTYRKKANYCNGALVLDEFEDTPNNTSHLVTTYNRDGYSRATMTNNNEVSYTPVRANALWCGNYLPESEPAAMSRLIILPFASQKEAKQKETMKAWNDLVRKQMKGTGKMLLEILSLRNDMEEHFSEHFEEYMERSRVISEVKDIRSAEKVAAIMATLMICHKTLGLTLIEVKEIEGFLMLQLKDQRSLTAGTDHVSQFFSVLSILVDDRNLVRGKHYEISLDETEVVFKLKNCYSIANLEAVKQRKTLLAQSGMKLRLRQHESFLSGTEKSDYRLRRNGLLGLCFKIEKLPRDIRETLKGNSSENLNF